MLETPAQTPPEAPDERPKADRRALRGRLIVREGTKASDRTTPRTLLAAIAVHVLVIAILVRLVTLGHGLHDWFGLKPLMETPQERITYVEPRKPEPKPPEPKRVPKPVVQEVQVEPTAPVLAPTPPTTEVAIDPALIAAGRSGGDSSSTGIGKPRPLGINPALIGLAPVNSDPRVWASGAGVINVPRSPQQLMDSVIGYAIAAAADSIDSIARLYDANRKPAEWVKRMKNGDKWGWDKTGLRLGKYTVPNALLALLPASAQRGMQSNPIEARSSRAILLAREDIDRFQSQALGEADFKKALKEIRARKDREYEVRSKARAAEDNKPKQSPPPKAASSGGN
ncbi:MAG: hypothetical protein ABJB74_21800 [Gemmatimonas sp.]